MINCFKSISNTMKSLLLHRFLLYSVFLLLGNVVRSCSFAYQCERFMYELIVIDVCSLFCVRWMVMLGGVEIVTV